MLSSNLLNGKYIDQFSPLWPANYTTFIECIEYADKIIIRYYFAHTQKKTHVRMTPRFENI